MRPRYTEPNLEAQAVYGEGRLLTQGSYLKSVP